MAVDASIVLKFLDQTQQGAQSARKSAEDVNKSYEELSAKTEALTQRQGALRQAYADLVPQVEAAKKALAEAKQEFKEDGSEQSATRLSEAASRYEELAGKLGDYKRGLADSRRELRSMDDQMRQTADSTRRSGAEMQQALTGTQLAMQQWGQQLVGALSTAGGYLISSGMTDSAGNVLSNILSGALSGASTGLLTGNPTGIAVGALIGAGAGLISGLAENAQKEDDFFRSWRDNVVTQVQQTQQERLSGGSAIAGTREQDLLAFGTLLGSPDVGARTLEEIKNMANFTPYYYDDLVAVAKQLSVYGYGREGGGDLMRTLTAIGNAGAAIGWNTSDQATVAQQLGFMGELENVSAMQVKQLLRKGLNVYDWLAEDMGISKDEVVKQISAGNVSGEMAVSSVLSHMEEKFDGAMEALSQTFGGLQSTVGGLTENLNAVMGESYNEVRKEGLSAEVSWLESSGMENVYAIIGEAQGYAENYSGAVRREAYDAVFNGAGFELIDDADAQELVQSLRAAYLEAAEGMASEDENERTIAGAKMEAIAQQTEAFATAYTEQSATMDAFHEAQLDANNGIAAIVAVLEAYKDAWAAKEAGTVGRAGATNGYYAAAVGDESGAYTDYFVQDGITYGTDVNGNVVALGSTDNMAQRAVGERRVPYDGYRIMAHRGERLLTRAEADAADKPQGVTVSVTGNTFNVRNDSDIDAIAEALAVKIERAARLAV